MNTALSVLFWIADTVEWLLSLDWWLALVFGPVVVGGGWMWLRPTGKRRRPRPSRPARRATPPALPEACHGEDPDEDPGDGRDQDTIVFQAVAYPRGEADS